MCIYIYSVHILYNIYDLKSLSSLRASAQYLSCLFPLQPIIQPTIFCAPKLNSLGAEQQNVAIEIGNL